MTMTRPISLATYVLFLVPALLARSQLGKWIALPAALVMRPLFLVSLLVGRWGHVLGQNMAEMVLQKAILLHPNSQNKIAPFGWHKIKFDVEIR